VIVRISGEGQYELGDEHHHRLNELDDAAVAAVDRDDEPGWATEGDDLRPSEVILPPADLSFTEAGADFTGEGLVPDPA
jgi:hypothetical protein